MRWVFLVGCYNSGTTLLERILRKHPDIAGLKTEGQFLTDALVSPKDVGVPRMWALKESLFRFSVDSKVEVAERVALDWMNQLDDSTRMLAVEKSPTNSARTRWLQKNFSRCCFIYIVRNGYATSLGIRDKVRLQFGDRDGLLQDAAFQWRRNCEVLKEDLPFLNECFELSYENLTENPVQTCQKLFSWLNLPPLKEDLLMQSYQIHECHGAICNQNHVRMNIMSDMEKDIITDIAAPMLRYHSYLK